MTFFITDFSLICPSVLITNIKLSKDYIFRIVYIMKRQICIHSPHGHESSVLVIREGTQNKCFFSGRTTPGNEINTDH